MAMRSSFLLCAVLLAFDCGAFRINQKRSKRAGRVAASWPVLDVTDPRLSIFQDGPKAMVFDYDGTLREFVNKPEDAVPSPELLHLFEVLQNREDIRLAIISSRDKNFLEQHFGHFKNIQLIAERGVWIWTWDLENNRGEWHRDPTVDNEWMTQALPFLKQAAENVPGCHVEEKDASMVWHYRAAAEHGAAEQATDTALRLAAKLKEELAMPGIVVQMSDHEKVVEVNSAFLTKGRSFANFLFPGFDQHQRLGELDLNYYTSVVVAGDGSADESMFQVGTKIGFDSHKLLSVKMDPNAGTGHDEAQTAANYKLREPADLRLLLANVAAMKIKG